MLGVILHFVPFIQKIGQLVSISWFKEHSSPFYKKFYPFVLLKK